MKTLYLECNMGAAGDMLMAALLELHSDRMGFLDRLNAAGISGVIVSAEMSTKCGITGTLVRVKVDGREEEDHHHVHRHSNVQDHSRDDHDHHSHHHNGNHHHGRDNHSAFRAPHSALKPHSHNSYHDIEHLIDHLNVSPFVKENALEVYKLIAEAESRAHGGPVDKIHFHEVGDMDAVADIVGVCMLIEDLAPDIIYASRVNVGGGHVSCAHGILPVPAPATAYILQGIPIYGEPSAGELCTPTGAALLKRFVKEFRAMPVMSVSKIGYGMGKRDFEKANCVRAYLGDGIWYDTRVNGGGFDADVYELACNLDDMTPEAVAFAQEFLFEAGALDVWTEPVGMKKGRPGIKFSCLCRGNSKAEILSLIFKHTTTLGIRENIVHRYTLQREHSEIQTPHGAVKIKTAHGFGVEKSKPEYEDIARIAREKNMSIQDVITALSTLPTVLSQEISPTPTVSPSP
jgi:uncharacterized protein (TIGR00299 family) protein